MKQIAIIFFSVLFLFGCSKEEEEECVLDNWLGTYIGVKSCDTEITDNYTFSITKDNSSFIGEPTAFSYLIIDEESYRFNPNDCSMSIFVDNTGGLGVSSTSTWENGNLRIVIDWGGTECTLVGTKQ